MIAARPRPRGRFPALLALAVAAASLPLLAPTCGGFAPGVKSFARGSLIIPMDVCYQCSTDSDALTDPNACGQTGYATPAGTAFDGMAGGKVCPQATDAGDAVRAYGLVYQLIRAGVPVYWVIKPGKTSLDDYDLTIHYGGGAPVLLYNWTNGSTGSPPTALADINYMGGLFVVDGSDFAAANAVLQGNVDSTCTASCETNRTRFGAVNVHVSNVAFQADVARTIAGGWNAGGAIAPKLALLDIGSAYADGTQAKNSEVVIRGYLQRAGLDFPNAGGTSAANAHGQIYDRLVMSDFQPSVANDWTTTRLFQNGYQALWVPHWAAPGSCSDFSSNTACQNSQYPDVQVENVIKTIAGFVTDTTLVNGRPAGVKDLFAECAGLGSFEGVPGNNTYSPAFLTGEQDLTHFHTEVTPGFSITTTTPGAPYFHGSYANPLMQIGDFEFVPRSGAISTYDAWDYKAGIVRLISENANQERDIFTYLPGSSSRGTVVYMGGHTYSGTDGAFHTAGTRLVLNTLFNLGATCVATGTTCSTGALGVCGVGTMTCDTNGDQVCTATGTATTETCNGLDDDCDGLVDENLSRACYDGPGGTQGVGLCQGGTQLCERKPDGSYGFGTCVGSIVPATEVCDGADNDCDNATDEALTRSCYTGPSSSLDPISGQPMGICTPGSQSCAGGSWGTCTGQTLPQTRECTIDTNEGDGEDDNCNGLVDEGCGCVEDAVQSCYSGPPATMTNAPCRAGTQRCSGNTWGTCQGEVVPAAEVCGNGVDDDCDGVSDAAEPACNVCTTQSCYDGPAGTAGVGICEAGTRACTDGVYGACLGQTLPSTEVCDGKDNDCDGNVDEGPPSCGSGLQCQNGVCVSAVCSAEQRCQTGYECTSSSGGTCVAINDCCLGPLDGGGNCTTSRGTCPLGAVCRNDSCVDPCDPDPCGEGTSCAGGLCTGGACYADGCPAGQLCRNGSCTADLCTGVSCPSGTFCREGYCVQACAYVSCLEGQLCGDDGFCKADPCAGASCGAGRTCVAGQCVDNLCATVDCGADKICRQVEGPSGWVATCIDNPCASVTCPTGFCLPREAPDCAAEPCVRAQCFASGNLGGVGTVEPLEKSGCGCGPGPASPTALLLGLLLLPLARRRRGTPARGAGPLALLLASGLTATLAGCVQKETGTDPADCVGTCNPGELTAPFVSSLSPASGLKGSPAPVTVTFDGARFQPGATLEIFPAGELAVGAVTVDSASRITAAIDLSAAKQDTYLVRVLNPGSVISNYSDFVSAYGTPVLTSISPTANPDEAPVAVTVTGSNFTAASECRVTSGGYTLALPTTLESTVPAGTELTCTLDPRAVPPGVVQVWVVNEGGLASAQRTFTVTAPLAATALSPPALPAFCSNPPGCTQSRVNTVVTIYGSGFTSASVVKADTATTPTTVRPTTFIDPTRLQATIDIQGIDPATLPFNLRLTVTQGAQVTTALVLPVVAPTSTIQVDTLSPQSAYQGTSSVPLVVSGSLIPASTNVQVLPPAGPNAGAWQTLAGSGSGASVSATLNLSNTTNWPAGDYEVRLAFPDSTYSVTFPFRVLSNVPTLWSYTSSPSTQRQGESVTVTVEGTTFFTGVKLRLVTPTGTRLSPNGDTTTWNTGPDPDTLVATFNLTGLDTGNYQLVAFNTTSGDSNPLTFSVAPGAPTLASLTPATVSQATSQLVTVTLTGTNFAKPDAVSGLGGSMVFIRNPALSVSPMTLPAAQVRVVDADTIEITLDTREALPAATCNPSDLTDGSTSYKVKVVNPGSSLLQSVERGFCLLRD